MSPVATEFALPFEAEYLWERARWLIRLRWFAVLGIIVTLAVATEVDLIVTPWEMGGVAGLMLAYNALLAWRLSPSPPERSEALRGAILVQLAADIVCLSMLLHFSDSVENPFVMLFAFPVAVSATLLPTRTAFALTVGALLFHSAVIVAEYHGIIEHHEFQSDHRAAVGDPMFHSAALLVGYLLAFAVLLIGVAYFVANLASRHRRAHAMWRHREHLAQSRERLARIGQLAAGVAHSVRNPLHGLLNGLDVLASRADDSPATQRTLGLMEDGLHRIETVTRRLLVLSREAPLDRRPTDIDDLVRDCAALLVSPRAGESRVAVDLRLGDVGVAVVDPDQLSEALANLLHNAVQACEQGGEVVITTGRNDEDDSIAITIADTGMGIAPEHVPHLFDAFFTTKAVGQGTGLGLPIARRAIEDHGGHVEIHSEEGRGTEVTVTLPRARPGEEMP